MKNCVGILDGTYIVLSQRPHIDGELFWCRKHIYSFNVQIICDDKKRIIFILLGIAGSGYDNSVFEQSKMAQTPHRYFSPGEHLIADAGYASSWYLCVPYKHPAAAVPINKIYNDLFSENRVPIENVNGSVKSRLCSLRGIRTQIREHKDFELVNRHIFACLILHNIMVDYKDDDFEYEEEDIIEEHDNVVDEILVHNQSGYELRNIVQQDLLAWGFVNNKF